MNLRNGNWGFGSPACVIGAAGAAVAAIARLVQELSGMDVEFLPLLADNLPGWLVADISVVGAAIIGGAIGQLGCMLVAWFNPDL